MSASCASVPTTLACTFLPAVNSALEAAVERAVSPLHEVCAHLLSSGSRIRAKLLLATVGESEEPGQQTRAVQAGAALELLHTATLIQDDVFDQGHTRRGRTATHLVFGKSLAILASDWLLIEAMRLAVEVDLRYSQLLTRAAQEMVIAEALDLQPAEVESFDQAHRHIRKVALGKTGSLFGAALAGGGIVGGAHPDQIGELWELGQELGATFQVIDDCKDLFASSGDTGKDVNQDISSGRLTMPILLALQRQTQSNESLCIRSLTQRKLTRKQREKIEGLIRGAALQQQLHSLLEQHSLNHRNAIRRMRFHPSLAHLIEKLCKWDLEEDRRETC